MHLQKTPKSFNILQTQVCSLIQCTRQVGFLNKLIVCSYTYKLEYLQGYHYH